MSSTSLVDSHVHLWDVERFDYEWLEALPRLNQTHGLQAYAEATSDVSVEEMVFVECTESFDDQVGRSEVQWVETLRQQEPRIRGIVAHASLEKGAASREHLNWLADRPLVTGVRRILQDESEAFFRQSDFVEGVQLLADYDFTFDLTVTASQMEAAIELVDRCQAVEFVLDHLGKPDIRNDGFDPWRTHLQWLAEREHVTCKLSGVLTEADPGAWSTADVRPYLDHALSCFGADRLFFGGDWPVLSIAAEYPTWVDVVETSLESLSPSERDRLFRLNAKEVYGLT